jgi:hypothetical protein
MSTKAEFLEACRSARVVTGQHGDDMLLIGDTIIEAGDFSCWLADALRLAPLQVVQPAKDVEAGIGYRGVTGLG